MKADHVFIIAEAGVNHNGSLDMALRLVDVAADAGADAIKFQTFRSENVISGSARKALYQIESTGNTETQLEMVKKLELGEQEHFKIVERCYQRDIRFLSTPFDSLSLRFLVDTLDISLIKIPSGEVTNAPFLLEIARTAKPVILSTGMSTLGEVEQALGVLAFGYLSPGEAPSLPGFCAAFNSLEGQRMLVDRVTLLHCTTEYPAPLCDVNLKAMETLHAAFGLTVGYSDHTEGIAVTIASVARGAAVIEKHFTLDRLLPGPDHRASLGPSELALMVRSVREVESALGSAIKMPSPSEFDNRTVARRSLVAGRDIVAGEAFSAENVAIKRPGIGISPFMYWELLGRKAIRNFAADEVIEQ